MEETAIQMENEHSEVKNFAIQMYEENKTLKSITKQITTDQIFNVIDSLVKHKFQSTYNFIAGFPNETIEDYKETLRTIYHIFEKCKYMVYPIPAPSFYCPLPGTKSFDDAVALGHKTPKSFEEWSDVDYNLKEMLWISKEFHAFIVRSRDIINQINSIFMYKIFVV